MNLETNAHFPSDRDRQNARIARGNGAAPRRADPMALPRILTLIALTTVVALLTLSIGCERREGGGAATKASPPDRLAAVQSRGELRVGYLIWEPCVVRGRPLRRLRACMRTW